MRFHVEDLIFQVEIFGFKRFLNHFEFQWDLIYCLYIYIYICVNPVAQNNQYGSGWMPKRPQSESRHWCFFLQSAIAVRWSQSPAQGPYLTRDATNNHSWIWYLHGVMNFHALCWGHWRFLQQPAAHRNHGSPPCIPRSLLELMLKSRLSRRLGCFHRLPIDVLKEESKVSSTLHSLRKLAILRTEMCDRPFQIVTDVFIRLSQFHQLTVGELEVLNLGELAKDGRPCLRIWNILRLVLVGDRTSPHHIKSAFGFGLRNVGRHVALELVTQDSSEKPLSWDTHSQSRLPLATISWHQFSKARSGSPRDDPVGSSSPSRRRLVASDMAPTLALASSIKCFSPGLWRRRPITISSWPCLAAR